MLVVDLYLAQETGIKQIDDIVIKAAYGVADSLLKVGCSRQCGPTLKFALWVQKFAMV